MEATKEVAIAELWEQVSLSPVLLNRLQRSTHAAHHHSNLYPPATLDVRVRPWPFPTVDVVYTANTLHIMSWDAVSDVFAGAAQVLRSHGRFVSYGPFRYHGAHTSEGNLRFDRQLRSQGVGSGIRDIDDLRALAVITGLDLCGDIAMPANNRLLIWSRQP